MSATSLQHRWKHEIQRAPLESSHDTSSSAEWLLAGIIDRVLHHLGHVPPLDGGIGAHDHADSETDTAIPDDDDDIDSLASQPTASLPPIKLLAMPACPLLMFLGDDHGVMLVIEDVFA